MITLELDENDRNSVMISLYNYINHVERVPLIAVEQLIEAAGQYAIKAGKPPPYASRSDFLHALKELYDKIGKAT